MANKRNGTFYTGVTANLVQRVAQHREGAIDGFTRQYGCKLLVYYEVHEDMLEAIAREKQIKAGSRRKKLALMKASTRTGRTCIRRSSEARPTIVSSRGAAG